MSAVHALILRDGIEKAREGVGSKRERLVVDVAHRVLSEDAEEVGFTISAFALTTLPHKAIAEPVWKRDGHRVTLLVESGHDRQGRAVGVPYGSYARLILLFLQSEAIRTGSRQIELGRSMRQWLDAMGLVAGGETYRLVADQAKRIANCRLQLYADYADQELMRHAGFVEGSISAASLPEQSGPWQDQVVLDEAFFQALRSRPVPVSMSALRAIGSRSMVIDVYIWLAYRLHALTKDMEVSWAALHAQFGVGFRLVRKFRAHFVKCLEVALAAYPDARVSIGDWGVTLRPSRPAIAKR